jgi:hypothetical protein
VKIVTLRDLHIIGYVKAFCGMEKEEEEEEEGFRAHGLLTQ